MTIETELHAILDRLHAETGACRVTMRLDSPEHGWTVADVCAEILAPGIKSMRGDHRIDQRAARTTAWITANHRTLVQPDVLAEGQPPPPAELLAAYGVRAQMLGPLLQPDGHLAGWISAHFTRGPEPFTPAQIAAMETARAEVSTLLKATA